MKTLTTVNILIVDDLEENLIALEALLRQDGVRVLRAHSGVEALELLLAHDVALALLDVQMPEMDGFELAELMRGTERTRQVPIIFLTAGAHDGQRVFRGYEVGAVDFLYKPIDPVMLGHKVSTFVNLHRQRVEISDMLRLHETFMAIVSHDLRTPLSAVVMGSMLLERTIEDDVPRKTLARMRSSAQRMTEMLDQLYDLARTRVGGGLAIEPKPVSARDVVERVVEELRVSYPARAMQLECKSDTFEGSWDEARLAQVASNLIGNALRHGTPDEPVVARVSVSTGSLRFEVHNGGVIRDELLPHLFDPFRQGAGRTNRESLGLGLYIVREIVAAHGGTIDVSSAPECGTTFSVRMPQHAGA